MSVENKFLQVSIPIRAWGAHAFGLSLGLIGWVGLASVFPNRLMPFPLETLQLTWGLVEQGVVWPHLWATLRRTLLAFAGTMVVGTGFGVIMGLNNYCQRLLIPYVIIGFSLPAIAWAAITTLVFGFGDIAVITATILVTFPIVTINIWKGVEHIDSELLYMSEVFGVSRRRLLVRMILPDIAPALFAAIRFGLTISWAIVIIGELFAASNGIGVMMINTYQAYRFKEAWAWAVVFMCVIIVIEYTIFKPLERKAFEHRPETEFALMG